MTILEEYKNLPSDIQVIDDFCPEVLLDILTQKINQFDWPWYYLQDTTYRIKYNDENKATWDEGFSTLLYVKAEKDDQGNTTGDVYKFKSPFFDVVFPILSHCEFITGMKVDKLKRVKVNLNTTSISNEPFEPHIDIPKYDVTTGLLYLNDSDGPTVIYDVKCPDEITDAVEALEYYRNNKDNMKVLAEIAPKKNRFILFNGRYFHSGSRPINHKSRFNLNINWEN